MNVRSAAGVMLEGCEVLWRENKEEERETEEGDIAAVSYDIMTSPHTSNDVSVQLGSIELNLLFNMTELSSISDFTFHCSSDDFQIQATYI